ncbi:winged helix-turn-helix domain-containing protein [Bradyrhizobium diazoefficiens]|nr:winged helix-turn-helix domain-containing protein [Bradyrhizobium diazoefficiens]MBR0850712.1 winged helix-turn-helix domain-containing protein [Bradyrhizobium diazoefficiens]
MRYIFENCSLDCDRRELHREAGVVSITPQVFDLLDYLIRNRDRVVSKDDLIRAIWNGRIVSDSALTTRLNAARTAVGDSGEDQRLIKTLPRKGFRFIGVVREEGRLPPTSSVVGNGRRNLKGQFDFGNPSRMSMVVLPFANIGGDPTQDYFVDGVTESLTTDLSRIARSFVIGRHTAFTYKGRPIDLKRVGRELNVRYALEGSVQRSGDRIRVNVQLVDTETGTHLWADRFDKAVADLFDLQDEIVAQLANTLKAELIAVEARRAERSAHPDATDFNFQGQACINKGATTRNLAAARDFFKRALAVDPRSVAALVGMAIADLLQAAGLLSEDRIAHFSAAEDRASEALSIYPSHATAHWVLGGAYIYTGRTVQGVAECEEALRLDHNAAYAHGFIGLAKYYMGRAAETEGHMIDALRLSPRDKHIYLWASCVATAKLQDGLDTEAAVWFRRSIEANRNFAFGHFCLAATLSLLGDHEEARVAARTGYALDPHFTIRRIVATRLSDNPTYLAGRARICEGMLLAGIAEG